MNYFDAIIISIVEGLTEFLPISSTGHMIVAGDFLQLPQSDLLTSFEIIIQLGAILAVVVYYRKRLHVILRLWQQIVIAFLPIAIVGFLFADHIKSLFSIGVVAWAFIAGGIIFLLVERWYGNSQQAEDGDRMATGQMSHSQAFFVGIAQILSLVPGASRSGMTIIGGMLSGLSRKASAEFSFFVAIPVMFAVALYESVAHYDMIQSGNEGLFVIGFVVAFAIAYLSISFLMRFLERFSFILFGWYRIVFGVILLLFFT